MITKRELKKLRRAIGYNGIQALHVRTGISKPSISAVMSGKYHNAKIIEAATIYAEELAQMNTSLKNRLKKVSA